MQARHYILGLMLLVAQSSFAKMEDVEAAQAKSREKFLERFEKFTQEKNVMGAAGKPDGSEIQGTIKRKKNDDDRNPFESDLTYHDFVYRVKDEQYNQKLQQQAQNNSNNGQPPKRERDLEAGISPHGAISASGGSSLLERTMYALHDQYSKIEEEKEYRQRQEQEGIKYEGVMKMETRQVMKKNGQPVANDIEADEVKRQERVSIREEAIGKVEEVGKGSFDGIDRAAKDDGKQDDPNAMGTIAFYYESANRALKAIWQSTMANLGQKRVNRISGTDRPKLNEDQATPERWEQKEISQIDPNASQQTRDDRIKEIRKQRQEMEKMIATKYSEINPEMDNGQNGQGGQGSQNPDAPRNVVNGKVEEEDPRERDWRLTLEMQNKAGKRLEDFQSNWQYTDDDNKATVTTGYDENGNASQKEKMRIDEQLTRYNDSLSKAAEGLEAVKARVPEIANTSQEVMSNQLPIGQLRADEITRYPEKAALEGYETVGKGPADGSNPQQAGAGALPPETYKDLLNMK